MKNLFAFLLITPQLFGVAHAESLNLIALKSAHNNKFVRAGVGDNTKLAASSSHVKSWETFKVVKLGDGNIALQSPQNGKYVRAGIGSNSYLAATSSKIQSWETFKVIALGDGKIALQSIQSGKYIRAGATSHAYLAANSPHIKSWETFYIEILSNNFLSAPFERKIEKWEMIPVFNYTYWCVPTSMSMILGFYDNFDRTIGGIAGHGKLIKFWFDHPDSHPSGSNVPSIIDEIIDPATRTWRKSPQGTHWSSHKDRVSALFGYDFDFIDCKASTDNDWCWDEIKEEVGAGRPFLWSTTSHTVTGYGYRIKDSGAKQVIVHDAPNTNTATYTNFYDYSLSKGITKVIPKRGDILDNLAILLPDGGESWKVNVTKIISWYVWGSQIRKVNIDFSNDGGRTWSSIATNINIVEGNNYYTWKGNAPVSQARIRIAGLDKNGKVIANDGSQTDFSIVK